MDSWQEVLLYIYFVIFLSLIQVFLELLEGEGVALLVGPEVLSLVLKALVGQMDLVVLGRGRVVVRRCPKIAVLVDINFEGVGHQGPNSNVKLSLLVKQGLLNVLLDNPILVYQRLGIQKGLDVPHLSHYFDASSLVGRLWLDQPNVLLAVFEWYPLTTREAFANFLKSLDELI